MASGSLSCAGTASRSRRLVEVQAPVSAETHRFYDYVPVEWGRRWPAEEIWAARKTV